MRPGTLLTAIAVMLTPAAIAIGVMTVQAALDDTTVEGADIPWFPAIYFGAIVLLMYIVGKFPEHDEIYGYWSPKLWTTGMAGLTSAAIVTGFLLWNSQEGPAAVAAWSSMTVATMSGSFILAWRWTRQWRPIVEIFALTVVALGVAWLVWAIWNAMFVPSR